MIVARCSLITKMYKVYGKVVYALQDVSLNINDGEFLGIVGPTGSGKTTLLNILGTFDRPSKGSVIINGIDVTRMGSAFGNSVLSNLRRNFLGFIFQSFNLIPELTVRENLILSMRIKVGEVKTKEIDDLLVKVGLSERADHLPFQLSSGEQQRAAIARALIGNPRLILADEPTGNLDYETAHSIFSIFKDLSVNDRVTIVVASHNPMINEFADRIVKLRNGRIVS
ncbi:MAG: ABC transporter ATP-binding protein [Thermoprotei archaeon]